MNMDEEYIGYLVGVALDTIESAYWDCPNEDVHRARADIMLTSFKNCSDDMHACNQALNTLHLLDDIAGDGEVDANLRMDAMWVLDELTGQGITMEKLNRFHVRR